VEKKLANVQEAMNSLVAPRELLTVMSGSANQTHPLVYECKQLCWSLFQNGIEVKLMWISSHVGLIGNKLVDERARHVVLEGFIFDRPLFPIDLQSLARPALIRAWTKRDFVDTSRFAHSIFPNEILWP
jgi:hypothetical protein